MPSWRLRNLLNVRLLAGVLCLTGMGVAAGAGPTRPTLQNETQPADAKYEIVRMSKPDGTVVEMRVPRHRSLLAKRPAGPRGTVRRLPGTAAAGEVPSETPQIGGRRAVRLQQAPTARASSEGPARPDSGRVVTQRANPQRADTGARISHPYTGSRQLTSGAVDVMRPTAVPRGGAVSQTPVVASDNASEWRTGLGWAPNKEDDETGRYLSDDDAFAELVPGDGWDGPTDDPGPIGNDSMPGWDAKAIARWDVVPYQTFDEPFHIGVVAFHMNGIDRVEFSVDGGPWVSVEEMQLNPRTDVWEYTAVLRPEFFEEDGLAEVRTIAYPHGAGIPRVLEPLHLYLNDTQSLPSAHLHVSTAGNDTTGDGSMARPFKTLKRALNACGSDLAAYDGATINIDTPGRYDIDQPSVVLNDRWITIQSAEDLSIGDVIIGAGTNQDLVRPNTRRLRFHRISVDFSDMNHMYKEDVHMQWYDGARWYYSLGWTYIPPASMLPVRNAGYKGLFVTDSVAEDMLYGFVNCNLVRGASLRRISGDVFQNSLMVTHSTVVNVDGTVLNHHSDLFQYFGHHDNLVAYDVIALDIIDTQNIFMNATDGSFSNCAFVNIAVQNTESDPPFSQLNCLHTHTIFQHISNPGQRFVLRDDASGSQQFRAHNVVFRNCVVERIQPGNYFDPIPQGVTIDHCHFSAGYPLGEAPTVGHIELLADDSGYYERSGEGLSKILGSATAIPGLSPFATTDRGAYARSPQ